MREPSLPMWHEVVGIFDGQEHTMPKWPLLGFSPVPAGHDALLLGCSALATLAGNQLCSDTSSVQVSKGDFGHWPPLCIGLSCTRWFCGMLLAVEVPRLVPPHLLLQWMQQATKLISISWSCAPPPFLRFPDQGHGEMIIVVLQETWPRFAFSSLLGIWGVRPPVKW